MKMWAVGLALILASGCSASYVEQREADRAKEREKFDPYKKSEYKAYQPKPALVPEGEAKGLSSAGEEAGPDDARVDPITGEAYVPDMRPLDSAPSDEDLRDGSGGGSKGQRCGNGYISSSKTCHGGKSRKSRRRR